jgi:transcriptional regulator with GAF, ATPase, and Fis domain/tetratricopeptide (TPR) repeat protein
MKSKDSTGEILDLFEQSRIYRETDNNSEALNCLKQARSLCSGCDGAGETGILGEILIGMADCMLEVGRYSEAGDLMDEIRRIAEETDNSVIEGKLHHRISRIHRYQGRYDEALESCLTAYEILKDSAENQEVAEIQRLLGKIYASLGKIEKARRFCEDSLSTFRRIGNEKGMVKTSHNLANIYFLTSHWEKAIDLLTGIVQTTRKLGSMKDLAIGLANLGAVYCSIGRWQEARENVRESITKFRQIGDTNRLIKGNIFLGTIYQIRRSFREAEEVYNSALNESKKGTFHSEEFISYISLGDLYLSKNNAEKGREFLDHAWAMKEKFKFKNNYVTILHRLYGDLYRREKDYLLAIRHADRALEGARKFGNCLEESLALRLKGIIYDETNDNEKAGRALNRSLEILKAEKLKYQMGITLYHYGEFLERKVAGDADRGREYLLQARNIFTELEDVYYLSLTYICESRNSRHELTPSQRIELLMKAEKCLDRRNDSDLFEIIDEWRKHLEDDMVERSWEASREESILSSLRDDPSLSSAHNSRKRKFRLMHLLEIIVKDVQADRGFISLEEEESEVPTVRANCNVSSEEARCITSKFIMTDNPSLAPGKPILSVSTRSDTRYAFLSRCSDRPVRSFLLLPIGDSRKIEGLLYLDRVSSRNGTFFSQEEVDNLLRLSSSIAFIVTAERREEWKSKYVAIKEKMFHGGDGGNIITQDPGLLEILRQIRYIRDSDITVLIEGETGSGKELLAEYIHGTSSRNERPFVARNCAEWSEHLLESELFGHRKGSFTDAYSDRRGHFEVADGGTFFLDEISEMGSQLQKKLLRVLETGIVTRVGEIEGKKVDVRIISATNTNLWEEVQKSRFREDLYYRLKVMRFEIPPLRSRIADIPLLVSHFVHLFNRKYGKTVRGVAQEVMDYFMQYSWPGNVRELRNVIESNLLLTPDGESITLDILPKDFRRTISLHSFSSGKGRDQQEGLKSFVEKVESTIITDVLRRYKGNKSATARELKLTLKGLRNKLQRYNIEYDGNR